MLFRCSFGRTSGLWFFSICSKTLQLAARAVLKPAEDAPTGRLKWGDTGAFVWNTQFWNKLSGEGKNGTNAYNYANVRRWTTRRGNLDVFALDLLLVPLGDGTHWTLGVVDFKRRELLHFCSLGWAKPTWFTCVKKLSGERGGAGAKRMA